MPLLYGFLHELLGRCHRLQQEIQALSLLPQESVGYRDWALRLLEEVEQRLGRLLRDPDIQVPELAKNYLHEYKRLAEFVHTFEWGPVLVLTRYSERDRLATLLCHHIAQEISYPYDPPLCAALSSKHYWTNPAANLIMIPAAEPFHLLGLSDLYHEAAHILLLREKNRLVNPFLRVVDQHFNTEIRRIQQEGRSAAYRDELEQHRRLWKRYWTLELASDMMAAYLAGPAYGWANLRLCMNLSEDLYASDPEELHTHPADDIRNVALCMMLQKIGFRESAEEIQKRWDQFVGLLGQPRPQEMDLRYPPTLLKQLRDVLHQGCGDLGLVSYDKQPVRRTEPNLTVLLNEAWKRFNEAPDPFAPWEQTQVEQLCTLLGRSEISEGW